MIIECKCKKYKFKIPDEEIIPPGRTVQCSMCNEEWYQEFQVKQKTTSNINEKKENDLLNEMNPSKNQGGHINKKKPGSKKEKKSHLLILTLIFFFLVFISYKFALHYKDQIISSHPDLKNFYESLEIIIEILKVNLIFIQELILETIKNIQNKI